MELQIKLIQPAHVLPLEALEDPSHCGAKAWRLARMHQWGYPVPPAVVLHSEVFQQLLALRIIAQSFFDQQLFVTG